MGGRGTSSGGGNMTQAINNAKNGGLGATREGIQDISSSAYGIDAGRLSTAERTSLARMAEKSEKNNKTVVQNIKDGNVAQINFSDFSSKDLESFIRMAGKVRTYSSMFAMNDALMVLSWRNQNK